MVGVTGSIPVAPTTSRLASDGWDLPRYEPPPRALQGSTFLYCAASRAGPCRACGVYSLAGMSPLELLSRFKDARVLVVGDVMLDRFVYARVSRLSPEAPVPVLAVEREALSLGGAGNVARNIASLGGQATLIGGKGRDDAGARLDELLSEDARIHNALVTSEHGRTTEKIRYIADRQQVMRADL